MNQEAGRRGAAWWEIDSPYGVLAILAVMNFLNYVDRAIVPPLIPLLTKPVSRGGFGLTDPQVGLLGSAFMVVHSLASLPLGLAADRFARKWVIAAGVGIWSVATAAAGLARTYAQLFVARAAVGIGEAAYAPAATAMISERFPPAARAKAMGIFQIGTFLGGAVAIVVGGWVGSRWGWRAAFLVVGGPGMVLTGLMFLVYEQVRRRGRPAPSAPGLADPSSSGSIAIQVRSPGSLQAAFWVNVAGVLITFFVGAFVFWGPTFVLRYHYPPDEELSKVTTPFGIVALVASVAGALFGSWLADRLERSRPGMGRLMTIAAGVAASVPCAALGLYAPTVPLLYLSFGAGVFFAVWYAGPILAALHDVVPPHRRATATGAYFMAVHLLGDAVSPSIVGFVSHQSWGSLRVGLLITVAVLALAVPAALLAIGGSQRVARLKHPGPAG